MLSLKAVEIHQGKRVNMDIAIRSQEDVRNWRDFSPETQKLIDVALDATDRELRGQRAITDGGNHE